MVYGSDRPKLGTSFGFGTCTSQLTEEQPAVNLIVGELEIVSSRSNLEMYLYFDSNERSQNK